MSPINYYTENTTTGAGHTWGFITTGYILGYFNFDIFIKVLQCCSLLVGITVGIVTLYGWYKKSHPKRKKKY